MGLSPILPCRRRDKHVCITVSKTKALVNSLLDAVLGKPLCDFAPRPICGALMSGDPDFGLRIVKRVGQFFSGSRSMSGTGYLRPRMCEALAL